MCKEHGVVKMKSSKMERKKRMEAFIRNDILESAIAVLMEQGIEKFTMDEVRYHVYGRQ